MNSLEKNANLILLINFITLFQPNEAVFPKHLYNNHLQITLLIKWGIIKKWK